MIQITLMSHGRQKSAVTEAKTTKVQIRNGSTHQHALTSEPGKAETETSKGRAGKPTQKQIPKERTYRQNNRECTYRQNNRERTCRQNNRVITKTRHGNTSNKQIDD